MLAAILMRDMYAVGSTLICPSPATLSHTYIFLAVGHASMSLQTFSREIAASPGQPPPVNILGMTTYDMEYPFVLFGSDLLAVPSPLPASHAPGRAWEAGKVLD